MGEEAADRWAEEEVNALLRPHAAAPYHPALPGNGENSQQRANTTMLIQRLSAGDHRKQMWPFRRSINKRLTDVEEAST